MAYSEDITRYLRCNRVIGQVLTPIVREYMQLTNVPPATVFQTIMQPYCERFRKRLSQKEMRIIQTLSSDHYKNFDITLMYKLARDKHFKMIILDYPTRKWGADPQHNEISIGDDIERIRLSRDHIMHSPTHLVSEREFNNFFDKFVDVAKRADAHINIAAFLSYEQQLEDLRRCHIDPKTTMKLYETLEENKNLKELVQLQQFTVFMDKDVEEYIEETRKGKEKLDETKRIKMVLNGLPNPARLAEIINSHREEIAIACKDSLIELEEASEGSLVLHLVVQRRLFQSDDKLHTQIDRFLETLFTVISVKPEFTSNNYILILLDDSFVSDSSSEEEDNIQVEIADKNLVLDLTVQNEAFQTDDSIRQSLNSFVEVLSRDINGQQIRKGHYHVIEYNLDAFPRVHRIQQNLSTCLNMAEIHGEISKVMYQYPRLVFYKGNDESSIDSFYLKNHRLTKTTVSPAEITTGIANGIPTVFMCVLKTENGHLTNIDRQCLHKIKKELPDHWIDKTLFVVSATSFSGSFRHFHTLSHELGKELDIEMSDITYRIFKDKDIGIFRRVSLHFESQLVEKRKVLCRNLEILKRKFHEAIQHTRSLSFELSLHVMLSAGPLGNNLLNTLTNSTRSYVWHGESFTRNKFTVTDATDKITRYTCTELGKVIVRTILEHFKNEVRSGNHDLFSVIFQHIDLKHFEITILRGIIVVLAYFLLGRLGWLVSAVVILIAGTDINSDSFRIEIANTMFTQINRNANQIISEVIETVRSDAMSRYNQFTSSLTSSETEIRRFFRKEKQIFRKDNIENEFGTIAGIHELIRNFKFEDDTLKIYASGNEENYEDVKEFVDAYFRPDVKTEVFMDQSTEGI